MKRAFLFLCTVIIPLTRLFAQQLEGTYCQSFGGFGGDCYTFFENKRFQYSYSDCTGSHAGSGTYTMNWKRITFHYTKDSIGIHANKAHITYLPASSDKVKLSVQVFDLRDSSALPFAAVVCEDTLTHARFGASTNLDGLVSFELPNNKQCYKISIRYIGFSFYDFVFIADRHCVLTVHLADNFNRQIADGTEETYKLKRRGKNKFLLKSKEDETWHAYKKEDN